MKTQQRRKSGKLIGQPLRARDEVSTITESHVKKTSWSKDYVFTVKEAFNIYLEFATKM